MKSIKKNENYDLKIIELGKNGEGIGYIEGKKVFVNNCIPGDELKVKIIKVSKNYMVGKPIKSIKKSKDHVEPKCPYYKLCGGCQIQMMDYQRQLEEKKNRVDHILNDIHGLSVKVEDTLGMDNPYDYRNKSSIPVSMTKSGPIMGFYKKNSHDIVDIDNCIIQNPKMNTVLNIFKSFIKDKNISVYDEKSHTGLVKQLMIRTSRIEDKFMVIVVVNGDQVDSIEFLIEELKNIDGFGSLILNINKEKTNRIMGYENKVIYGQEVLIDRILDMNFEISPNSFFQINPVQTDTLYSKVLEYADLKGNETVYDLYCGIGSITGFLARNAKKVYGIEVVQVAVENARKNMALNNIENTEFFAGKAEELIENLASEKERPDLVVVDPPRKGCEESVLKTIADIEVERIVYVSCLPESLGRDLEYLVSSGYKIEKVQPVDMFCHSYHVETVVSLKRK
jgi:23S rRNA (uracil1939-C5)-methyltransferase